MTFDFSLEPGRLLENKFSVIEESPLVSIITPYYNSGKYFEQTYNCVINQSFPYFEWIIVNDGSTNEADVELIERFARTDSRIRVIHKENGGPASARNIAIKESKTEMMVMLDSDDLITPIFIECLFWSLICNPEASWSYTGLVAFSGANYLWRKEFSSEVEKKENVLIVSCAVRKNDLEEVGCYSELTRLYNEDWHLWLKLLAAGKYPVHLSQYGFWYRVSNTGAYAASTNDESIREKNSKFIQDAASAVPDGIKAITFSGKKCKEFEKPRKWDWERKLNFKKEKTKILMLIPHMERGGADKFNLDIITNINKEKFEIGIITTVPAQSDWKQLFSEQVRDVFELSTFLDMNDWSAFIHYYIKSRGVNIVMNISSYYGYYILPWLRKEFPQVAIIDCVHAEGKYWRAGGYPRVSAAMDCVIDESLVSNEFTRNIMVDKYGKDRGKTKVIYTGVDETYFNPDEVDCSGIKEQYGISKSRPVVLYLCRIAAEKRPFLMLEIARETRKHIKDVCFLVVGDGPQIHELRNKVNDEGLSNTILIIGKQNDIRPFYKVCDLFLLTSIKEGLSITTLEAMLMGKPVVSADVGSQYEVVTDKTGRIIPCRQDEAVDFDIRNFPQEEISDYVDAIVELLGGKVDLIKMRQACREKVLQGFTLNYMIDVLEKEFILLLAPDAIIKRETVHKALSYLDSITEDYLTLYIAYENKDLESAEIWNTREWYRMLYEQVCREKQIEFLPIAVSPTDAEYASSQAELRLQEIYKMRSWRLIRKYQQIMDNTIVGKLLSKFRDALRK